MKQIIIFCLLLTSVAVRGQYNPSTATVTNKPLGIAQAVPTDARSYYYDASLFIWRPYQSTAEVLTFLNLTKYRVGQFSIFVNEGGSLQSNGSFVGGVIKEYWFKDGTSNSNLTLKTSFPYSDSAARAAALPYVAHYSLKQFGYIAGYFDNTNVINYADSMVWVLGGGVIDFPAGLIIANGRLNKHDKVYWQGAGRGATTIDMTLATVSSSNIDAEGTLTNLPTISTSINKGDTILNFSSAHGLHTGDAIIIHDTAQFSFSTARSYYKKGEYFTVKDSLSPTRIVVTTNSFDAYATGSNILMYKINPVTMGISSMSIKFKRNNLVRGINVSLGVGCKFYDLYLTGNQHANIAFDRCYNTRMDNCQVFDNNEAVGYNYGLAIFNCQRISVNNSQFETMRHGITVGGQDYFGTVVNREITIDGVYANSLTTEPGMDTHGNCEFISIRNCTLPSGVVLSGDNGIFQNNTVGNQNNGGQAIAFTEQLGNSFVVKGNTFNAYQNFLYLIREVYSKDTKRNGGVFDFSGNTINLDTFHHPSYPTVNTNVINISTIDTVGTEDLNINITDNTINAKDTTSGLYAGIFVSPVKLKGFGNVTIENNKLYGCGIQVYNNIKGISSITGNKIYGSVGYGINYIDYITPIVDLGQKTVIIDRNIVTGARRTGIYLNQQNMGKKYSNIYVRNNTSIRNGVQSSQSEFSFWALGAKYLQLSGNTFGEDSTVALNSNIYRVDSIANFLEYDNQNINYGKNSKVPLWASVDNELPVVEHNNIKKKYGSAAPVTGTWALADKVYTAAPVQGGNEGWICTVAGTPGTWKPFGIIDFGNYNGLIYQTTIPNAVDLNTYQTSGIYEQVSSANAAAGTNYPVATAGELRVFQNHPDFTYQEYYSFVNNGYYVRTRYQSTWNAWRKLFSGATTTVTNGALPIGVTSSGDFNVAVPTGTFGVIVTASSGGLNFKSDTALMATNSQVQHRLDSLSATLIKTGIAFFSGDGSTTTFDIILPTTPTWANAEASSAAGANITYRTPITNGIRIFYAVAPVSGSNNISISYQYK